MKQPDEIPDFKDYIDTEDVAMTMYALHPRECAWLTLPLERRLEWIAMAEAACHLSFEVAYEAGYEEGYSEGEDIGVRNAEALANAYA